MKGTLLHVTRQDVACFVFLCFNYIFLLNNNIQKVDTFHGRNLTAHVGRAVPITQRKLGERHYCFKASPRLVMVYA